MAQSSQYEEYISIAASVPDIGDRYFALQSVKAQILQRRDDNRSEIKFINRMATRARAVIGGLAGFTALAAVAVPAYVAVGGVAAIATISVPFAVGALAAIGAGVTFCVALKGAVEAGAYVARKLKPLSSRIQQFYTKDLREENTALQRHVKTAEQKINDLVEQTTPEMVVQSSRLTHLVTVPAFVNKLRNAFKTATSKEPAIEQPTPLLETAASPQPAV